MLFRGGVSFGAVKKGKKEKNEDIRMPTHEMLKN